ncbi:DUF885 domain-containing protein [Dermabacteraceae bacterium P13264]
MSTDNTAERTPTAIDRLADGYLDTVAHMDPFAATSMGVAGYDTEVTDYSPAGIEAVTQVTRDLLSALDGVADEDEVDAVTRAALKERLGLQVEFAEALIPHTQVNNLTSPIQGARQVFDLMPSKTEEDWEVIATRLEKLPQSLRSWQESLRYGMEQSVMSSQRMLLLGAEDAQNLAEADGFFMRFAQNAQGSEGLRERVFAAAQGAAAAYGELAETLREMAPHGRASDGVGREAYQLYSRNFLGEEIDLEETYAWGTEELQRIIAEQEEVAERINAHYGNGGGRSVQAARDSLDADPARTIHGTDNLQSWMQELSDQAVRELRGTHFDIPEELLALECCIAQTGAGGIYYTAPSEDFSRPGRMWWDVPTGVTEFHTWTETTTVYHEGVPGHHLQLGTQVLAGRSLNRWRGLGCWVSGHGEGWALYAERLMEQLGYLDDDGDRLGMLDAQRMRAGRVVLDIGMHCGFDMPAPFGEGAWTYDKAWEFMADNWGMEVNQRRFELNRYLGWPGQAPSYKVGQRLWEQLRAESEANGESARDFHARALRLGSLPLSVLRQALK